jgi:hypothetical protein
MCFPATSGSLLLLLLAQLVPEPCDVTKATNITFDASFSRDGSGRPLVKYLWASVGTMDVVLASAASVANIAEQGAGASRWDTAMIRANTLCAVRWTLHASKIL